MTGYFDPGRPRPGTLRCSYHDDNLAGFQKRLDLRIDPGSRWFRPERSSTSAGCMTTSI